MSVKWLESPELHDYEAAADYLGLLLPPAGANLVKSNLHYGPAYDTVQHPAKDLLRAAQLPLLDKDNKHVRRDLDKIEAGERMSPILLVRGNWQIGAPLLIADGYHRVCAAYHHDENTLIPARMTWLPAYTTS